MLCVTHHIALFNYHRRLRCESYQFWTASGKTEHLRVCSWLKTLCFPCLPSSGCICSTSNHNAYHNARKHILWTSQSDLLICSCEWSPISSNRTLRALLPKSTFTQSSGYQLHELHCIPAAGRSKAMYRPGCWGTCCRVCHTVLDAVRPNWKVLETKLKQRISLVKRVYLQGENLLTSEYSLPFYLSVIGFGPDKLFAISGGCRWTRAMDVGVFAKKRMASSFVHLQITF